MMRAFTSDVKVIDRTRVCVLLVLVFICSIDRSSSVDAADNTTTVALSFRHPGTLTDRQRSSAVTIEFDFKHIDKKNRTAVEFARREVRRKILEYLNRWKSTTASPTYSTTAALATTTVAIATATTSAAATTTTPPPPPPPTTTITLTSTTVITTPTTPTMTTAALTTASTTSVVETTPQIFTTVAPTTTTTGHPQPERKRRRRNSGGNNYTFTDDDLPFVENDPEIDEKGNLRISLFIDKEGLGDHDLLEILRCLNETKDFEEIAPVVKIYEGLPKDNVNVSVTTMQSATPAAVAVANFQVWLPILLAILLLLIIFIIVFCCWMAKNKKKVKDDDRKKIIPPLNSKPSTSNGNAPPKILDDNHGWLVPMAQYSNEEC